MTTKITQDQQKSSSKAGSHICIRHDDTQKLQVIAPDNDNFFILPSSATIAMQSASAVDARMREVRDRAPKLLDRVYEWCASHPEVVCAYAGPDRSTPGQTLVLVTDDSVERFGFDDEATALDAILGREFGDFNITVFNISNCDIDDLGVFIHRDKSGMIYERQDREDQG